ncbi:hypothetical protein C2857_004943 [Epichloe festucae Fl1]|uniref:Uncharacterized protein n=1 Tax=Epichloe festucae (strain Fl1) TaxID=877507 RepID=A0A7S9KKT0_EPIFF|nr:hypothetical protein C2857_004943 [Epichloe festucae Fl1]
MDIQIFSDLHLESPKAYDLYNIPPKAPYLALALLGDIGNVVAHKGITKHIMRAGKKLSLFPQVSDTQLTAESRVEMLSANEFTCFGLLPPELQSQIWREALSDFSTCAATPDFTAGPPDLRPDGPSQALSYWPKSVDSVGLEAVEPEKAAHYTSLLARTSCGLEDHDSTTTHIRSILLEYFAGSPPTIHILPPT